MATTYTKKFKEFIQEWNPEGDDYIVGYRSLDDSEIRIPLLAVDNSITANKYIRKDIDDYANGLIKFNKGLNTGGSVMSTIYLQGLNGWIGTREGDFEMNSLTLREFLEVPELRKNKITVMGNQFWFTDSAMVKIADGIGSGNYNVYFKLEEDEYSSFELNDILKGIYHYGNGFWTTYLKVYELILDPNTLCEIGVRVHSLNGRDPRKSMLLARINNSKDKTRQGSIFADGIRRYIRVLYGYDDTEPTSEGTLQTLKVQLGDLSTIKNHPTFGDLTGYGLYAENAYLTGKLIVKNDENDPGQMLGAYRGIWNSTTKYFKYNQVSHKGSLFAAKLTSRVLTVFDPVTGLPVRDPDGNIVTETEVNVNRTPIGGIDDDWWEMVISKGDSAATAILELTNDNHLIQTDAEGKNPSYGGAYSTAYVYYGITDVTENYKITATVESPLTVDDLKFVQNGNTVTITFISDKVDGGGIKFTATPKVPDPKPDPKPKAEPGVPPVEPPVPPLPAITRTWSISKLKSGKPGENATAYWLVTDTPVIKKIKYNVGGTETIKYEPNPFVIRAFSQNGIGPITQYSGYIKLTYGSQVQVVAGSVYQFVPSANVTSYTIELFQDVGLTTLLDKEIVTVVENGADGEVHDWHTYIFKNSITMPTVPTFAIPPTTFPADGWYDYPNSTGVWWMSTAVVNGKTGATAKWSMPIRTTGEDGANGVDGISSFKSTVFKRSNTAPATPTGGSYITPVPNGWSDGAPTGTAILWSSTRVFSTSGNPPQTNEWTTPAALTDTASLQVRFSSVSLSPGDPTNNPSNWSTTATDSTIWMATRVGANGVWDSWQISKVKGENGINGADGVSGVSSFKSIVFTRTNTKPNAPTGGSYSSPIPSGWSDGVPVGSAKLWSSNRVFSSTGNPPQTTVWTDPSQMTDTASFEVRYSNLTTNPGDPTSNPNNWYITSAAASVWMATRTMSNGVWSSWEVNKILGESGSNGTSIVWKGTFPSHPANPSDGWAYYNSTDNKSYVYQSGAWYQMTVDGVNGQNGNSTFKSTVFKRTNATPSTPTGGSYINPVPSGWTDGASSGVEKLWASTRIFTSDGLAPQQSVWTTPAQMTDTASFQARYSTIANAPGNPTTNPSNWSTTASVNTIWMATREASNGIWGDWQVSKIKGEDGGQGPQGVPGIPGSDGITYYTWIRYADTVTGSGISNDPTGKLFIGFAYNKSTAVESNIPSDYMWSKYHGEDGTQGIPGKPGIDGIIYYTWIAYSDYADGKNMYQIPNDNTMYIGIAVNKLTATESTNPADYTWSKFKGENGIDITWKGDLKEPPANPQLNWVYRDTDNGRVYIWNGSAWELMVVDGTNGADGANGSNGVSVFVTYNDSGIYSKPAIPTGNGTTGGWHTTPTSACVWMSQKVGYNATDGVWGNPIQLRGEDGGYVDFKYNTSLGMNIVPAIDKTARYPAGWTDVPPTVTTGVFLWMASAFINPNNTLNGQWSDPMRISGETGPIGPQGIQGLHGEDGLQGPSIVFGGIWSETMQYYGYNTTQTCVLYNGKYYYTKTVSPELSPITIPSGAANHPGSTTGKIYWNEFAGQFSSIATGLLLAERIATSELTANKLFIVDRQESTGNIIASDGSIITKDEEKNLNPSQIIGRLTTGWYMDQGVIRSIAVNSDKTPKLVLGKDGKITATGVTVTGTVYFENGTIGNMQVFNDGTWSSTVNGPFPASTGFYYLRKNNGVTITPQGHIIGKDYFLTGDSTQGPSVFIGDIYVPGSSVPGTDDSTLTAFFKLFNSLFERVLIGSQYVIKAKLPLFSIGDITAYGNDGMVIPSLWDGIPVDKVTIDMINGKLTAIGSTGGIKGIVLPAMTNEDALVGASLNSSGDTITFTKGTFATKSYVTSQGYITSSALTPYATTTWVTAEIGKIPSVDLSSYAKKDGSNATGNWSIAISGNAATANTATLATASIRLFTARSINGVAFDGTKDISIAVGISTWAELSGKPSWIGNSKPSYVWSEIGNKPSTISGYGITDAKIVNGVITIGTVTITPLTSHQSLYGYATESWVNNQAFLTSVSWSIVGGKPTTISGYGITDAVNTSDGRLTDARPAGDVYAWAKASVKPAYTWPEIFNKPSTFTPSAHTHAISDITGLSLDWGSITNKPETATRWSAWSEVTSKPTSFVPSAHTHAVSDITNLSIAWAYVSNKPETATRWPSWGEVTSKPTLFTPSAHSHVSADITNLSSATVGYALESKLLRTNYISGVQNNPQTYFDRYTGVKVAMTGAWNGSWSDTLWVNGYSGTDVPNMCALHFLRGGTPRVAISTQVSDATTYGALYEILTDYNYNSKCPKLDGTGATGRWHIDISGQSTSLQNIATTTGNNMLDSGISLWYWNQWQGNTEGIPASHMCGLNMRAQDAAYGMQIGTTAFNHVMYFRKYYSGTYLPWRTFAFLDSNVYSATKLQTSRTIWGQSFDGTGNISGAITNASTGSFSGIVVAPSFAVGSVCYTNNNSNVNVPDIYGGVNELCLGSTYDNLHINYRTSRNGVRILNYYLCDGSASASSYAKLSVGKFTALASGYGDYNGAISIIAVLPSAPYGLCTYIFSSGKVSLQAQRVNDRSEVFPLFLNENGGNVSISTPNNTYKLNVGGDILASGGWVRTSGGQGWYNDTYGGGWHMVDTTYLRSYNGKAIYTTSTAYYSFETSGGFHSKANYSIVGTSWQEVSNNVQCCFNTENKGVPRTSYHLILGWADVISGAGYQTRYTISSFRNGYNFGAMTFSITNNDNGTSGRQLVLYANGELNWNGSIVASNEITAYSDKRLKSNISNLSFRGKLTPKTYIKDDKQSIGFIAQDVQQLYPELVIVGSDDNHYLSLNYCNITAVLSAQINIVDDEVEVLKHKVQQLEQEIIILKNKKQ